MNAAHLESRLTRVAGILLILIPPAFVLAIAVADILGMLISGLFLLRGLVRCDAAWRRRRWMQIALLLWAYLMLRAAFTPDPWPSLAVAATWGRFPLLAAALSEWLLRDPALRRRLWMSWAATAGLLALDALLQYATGHDLLGHAVIPALPAGSIRLTGPFRDPKIGIVLCWLAFPVIAGISGERGGRPGAILAWAGLALTVFLTGERMAFLLILLGAALLWLATPRLRWQGGLAMLAALAALAFLAHARPEMTQRQIGSTVASFQRMADSPYGRIWQSGLAMVERNPLFGVGPHRFRAACPDARYGDPSVEAVAIRCNTHPHQIYLEWLSEDGLIGLGLFLALIAVLAAALWRGRAGAMAEAAWPGLIVLLVLRLWPLATSASFFIAWSTLLFWIALGWALAVVHREESA